MSPLKDTDPAVIRMIVILATIIAGVVITWIKQRSVGAKVDKTIELAAPTGNGFAADTKRSLEAIRTLVVQSDRHANERADRIEAKIDAHLQAHSTADVQRPHN